MYSSTPEIVQLLLEKGAEIEARDTYGWTPLMIAIWYSTPKIVQLLIEKGAEVNARDKDGLTPLMIAAKLKALKGMGYDARSNEIIEMLKAAGARE